MPCRARHEVHVRTCLHAIALSPFIGHLPTTLESPTDRFSAEENMCVKEFLHPHSCRPLKGNRHSQLLAVTWELLRPSTQEGHEGGGIDAHEEAALVAVPEAGFMKPLWSTSWDNPL